MTVHINELIQLLAKIYEDKNMKATGSECLKGGVITGLSAAIGGLLLGPLGLAIGGIFGGLGSAITANDFQSVAVILRNMSASQKKELANYLVAAFRDFGSTDVITLTMLLTSNHGLQELALNLVNDYLKREMQMRVKS